MSLSAHERSTKDVFSAEFAADLVSYLDTLEDSWWFNRKKINSIPTKGITECDYWFLGHNQMPVELRELLFHIAPKVEGAWLGEVLINRYEIGTGMPEHIDQAVYRYNMVIALNDNGDGITINGEFYQDVPGRATIFPIRSEPHEVPPVKNKRYVLIYLYE
ncbi:hypothetical protein RVBP20_1730 [Pseudomonas phage sp. NK1]|uniref:Uncharacterized protein n=1 Tax=Pseudomonas phage PA7 TaxID=347330 RepID=A0AAE7S7Z1_9CAUD|nr:hypothetical protein [Pseudomonas phage PA7]BDR26932.1 hypothetical protein RVBP20_1730 [Pseudomonas phage sp. NK1]